MNFIVTQNRLGSALIFITDAAIIRTSSPECLLSTLFMKAPFESNIRYTKIIKVTFINSIYTFFT